MENLDKSKLEADVNGQSAQIQIKTPAAQVGARLSKRFKGGFLVLVGALVTIMMIGIMTAGNQEQNSQSASGGSEQVGLSTPDIGSMQKRASDLVLQQQSTGDVVMGQGNSQTGQVATQSVPNGQPSPADVHQQWKQEQYYKAEQSRLANSQSAAGATLAVNGLNGGARSYNATAMGSTAPAPVAPGFDANAMRLQTAQAAAAAQNGGVGPGGVYPQTGNKDFVSDQRKPDSVYLNSALSNPIGKYELFASSVIPAVTLSGINSDLPGSVSAQVRQTVYDSRDGRTVIIPQGTRVIGEYSSGVSYGQKRVLIAWQHLVFPNGQSLPIQGMLGADGQGQSGLYDQVDNHYMKIFGSALMIAVLGVAAQQSQPQNTSLLSSSSTGSSAAGAASAQLNTVGSNLLNKNLNIAPTLIIQPGFAFNIMVNKTMVLPAYK